MDSALVSAVGGNPNDRNTAQYDYVLEYEQLKNSQIPET